MTREFDKEEIKDNLQDIEEELEEKEEEESDQDIEDIEEQGYDKKKIKRDN